MNTLFLDPVYRPYFIGYSDMIKRVNDMTNSFAKQTYPPFNLKKTKETEYLIELAVAGFQKEDIEVEVKDSILTIKSVMKTDEKVEEEWLHRGIGLRNFTRQFTLAENVVVKGAEMKNGLLRVFLESVIPDSQKPQKVEIL